MEKVNSINCRERHTQRERAAPSLRNFHIHRHVLRLWDAEEQREGLEESMERGSSPCALLRRALESSW